MSSLSSQMCNRVTLKYCWWEGGGEGHCNGLLSHITSRVEKKYTSPAPSWLTSPLSTKGTRSRHSQKLYVCVCHRPDYAPLPVPPLTNILPPHQILTGQNITVSVLSHILLQFTSFCTVWFSFVSFQGLKRLMSEEAV